MPRSDSLTAMPTTRIRLARAQIEAALTVASTRAATTLDAGVYNPDTRMTLIDVPHDQRLAVRDALRGARLMLPATVYAAHFERAMTALLGAPSC